VVRQTSVNHITGLSREQRLLLPEAVEDYIAAEHPVRFIDAFVNALDLRALGFGKAVAAYTGRPPYDPGDLLRLYIYGYLHRLRSSRLLEQECTRNLEVIWLLRTLKPDFKTIADFRRDNKKPLQQTCREFTLLCKKLDLFGGELVAVDGSKFKAVNSKDRNYNEKKLRELIGNIDAQIEKYMAELTRGDRDEPPETGGRLTRAELEAKIAQLKERQSGYEELSGQLDEQEKQISTTDPDARLMHTRLGTEVCYNVQTAVDARHKLIVAHDVVNDATDVQQLAGMARSAQETLGVKSLKVVADKGYYSNVEVQRCVEQGITPCMDKADTSANTKLGLYGKSKFAFDALKDVYLCPGNQELTHRFSTFEKERELRYYRASGCRSCALKPQCTRNKANRTITREENEALMEAMAQRVKADRGIMKLRKAIVEHPFGTIKRTMNAGYFLCKRLAGVGAEMSLTVLAYNLKRALNIVNFAGLIKAVTVNG
jgi:transposase